MSRRFRLQTLQRLRVAGFESATASVGDARRSVADAQLTVATLEQAMIACVPDPRAAPWTVQAAATHRESLRERVDAARGDESRALSDLQVAIDLWHRARADLRVVENLNERHRHNLAEADARRDQRIGDDLAVTVLRFPGLARVGANDPANHPADGGPDGSDGGEAA